MQLYTLQARTLSPGPLFFFIHQSISLFLEFLSMLSSNDATDSLPSAIIPRLSSKSLHNSLASSHILGLVLILKYCQSLQVAVNLCKTMLKTFLT